MNGIYLFCNGALLCCLLSVLAVLTEASTSEGHYRVASLQHDWISANVNETRSQVRGDGWQFSTEAVADLPWQLSGGCGANPMYDTGDGCGAFFPPDGIFGMGTCAGLHPPATASWITANYTFQQAYNFVLLSTQAFRLQSQCFGGDSTTLVFGAILQGVDTEVLRSDTVPCEDAPVTADATLANIHVGDVVYVRLDRKANSNSDGTFIDLIITANCSSDPCDNSWCQPSAHYACGHCGVASYVPLFCCKGNYDCTVPPPSVFETLQNCSHSMSQSNSLTASVSTLRSPSQSPLGSPSQSTTPSPLPSPTQSPLGSPSQSTTPSPLPSPTQSPLRSPSQSMTHSPSMTLTELLSASTTPRKTFTDSFFDTISSAVSLSASVTISESLHSASLPVTASAAVTASLSEEVYCGGLLDASCRQLAGICNQSEESLCYAAHCWELLAEGMCLQHGCEWKGSRGCLKPMECKEMLDPVSCQRRLACRWSADETRCFVDMTICSEFDSLSLCTDSGCSFNSFAHPSCFKPITSPALCRMVTHAAVCVAQGCLWFDAIGSCESWEVQCEDLPPSQQSCWFLPLCAFNLENRKCESFNNVNFDTLNWMLVIGAKSPAVVLPGDVFALRLMGTEVPETAPIVAVPAAAGTCPSPQEMTTSALSFTAQVYDRAQRTSLVTNANILQEGNYSFCVLANDTHVLGPFGHTAVVLRPAVLDSCSVIEAYANTTFSIILVDRDLDTSGRILLVRLGSACPIAVSSQFMPVTRHDERSGTSVVSTSVREGGNFTLCYTNRANLTAGCPVPIVVHTLAPWFDNEIVFEHLKSFPLIDGVRPEQFNNRTCKTVSSNRFPFGAAIHPTGMPVYFGDGVNPYVGNEVCLFIVAPIENKATRALQALFIDVHYVSLQPMDELRVFIKEATSASGTMTPPQCSAFKLRAQCLTVGCQWTTTADSEGFCGVETSRIDSCPASLEGHRLFRVYKTTPATRKKIRLAVPLSGVVAFACSNSLNENSNLGMTMTYNRQETYCPNDCKDVDGTVRGSCVPSFEMYTFKCVCGDGFSGDDCSRRTLCRGTGPLAETFRGAFVHNTVAIKPEPCGFLLRADPALGDTPMQKWGISVAVLTSSLSYADCDMNYILLRSGGYDGSVLKRICRNDVQGVASSSSATTGNRRTGELLREILSDTDTVYVELRGEVGDVATVEFAAISISCPSTSSSGPTTSQEKCDGRGECVEVDKYKTIQLPTALYGCACRLPHAATFLGRTCDTCAFGFMKDTFPACESSVFCAANCSGHGTCIEKVGCRCFGGWYGLDCNLIDDAERIGELKDDLRVRVPLNARYAGNVVSSGSIDRTFLWCSLPGAPGRCRNDTRKRGRVYARQDNVVSSFVATRRRLVGATNSNATPELRTDGIDEGIALNMDVIDGVFPPDFIRIDNITEVSGELTVAAWVKATFTTEGVLFAVVDNAFYPDGRSETLEHTLEAVQNRFRAKTTLGLANVVPNTHIAIVLNGPQKRVDLLVSDHTKKPSPRTLSVPTAAVDAEEWMYVRHFRLGDRVTELFDGTWRFFVLKMYEKHRRLEARVYIDGFSKGSDPDFVQCIPYLPPLIPQGSPTFNDSAVSSAVTSVVSTSRSIAWGYRFEGSLDELLLFDKDVPQRLIIEIGGSDFRSALPINSEAAVVLVAICAVCLATVAIPFAVWLWKRRQRVRSFDYHVEEPHGVLCPSGSTVDLVPPVVDVSSKVTAGTVGQPPTPAAIHQGPTKVWSSPPPTPSPKSTTSSEVRRTSSNHNDPVSSSATHGVTDCNNLQDHEEAPPSRIEAHAEQPDDDTSVLPLDEDTVVARLEKQLHEQLQTKDELEARVRRVVTRLSEANHVDTNFLAVVTQDLQDALGDADLAPRNLRVLVQLDHVIRADDDRRERKGNKKKEISKGGTNSTKSSSSSSGTGTKSASAAVASTQILGQMTSTMSTPPLWNVTFGGVALFFAADFLPIFGIPFVYMFIVMFTLALISFIALLVVHFRTKALTQMEIIDEIDGIVENREKCLEQSVPYKRKKLKSARLIEALVMLLGLTYMPVTQQAMMILFCHPNISCLYDCYNEQAHKDLMIVAAIALASVTLLVPIFYLVVVRRFVTQYNTYIVTFDPALQARHWQTYTAAVLTPFSTLWDKLLNQHAYFEAVFLAFRALMSSLMVGLDSESLEQLACVVVAQILFTIFVLSSEPYHSKTTNNVLSFCNLHVVAMLLLMSAYVLVPHTGVAIAMVVVTVIGVVALTAIVVTAVVQLVWRQVQDRRAAKEAD